MLMHSSNYLTHTPSDVAQKSKDGATGLISAVAGSDDNCHPIKNVTDPTERCTELNEQLSAACSTPSARFIWCTVKQKNRSRCLQLSAEGIRRRGRDGGANRRGTEVKPAAQTSWEVLELLLLCSEASSLICLRGFEVTLPRQS